jgi:hypothetical protein
MDETVLLEELHLCLSVPASLPEGRADAIVGTLRGDAFAARLGIAIAQTLSAFPIPEVFFEVTR